MKDDEMEEIDSFADGELEIDALVGLMKGKRPKKNPKAEAEKKAGDRQRADVRMRGFKPLPIQLSGYVVDIKERPEYMGDYHGGRVWEHGDIDTSTMIDRILVAKPPESDPKTVKMNARFLERRKEAVKKAKARRKKEAKKRWKAARKSR